MDPKDNTTTAAPAAKKNTVTTVTSKNTQYTRVLPCKNVRMELYDEAGNHLGTLVGDAKAFDTGSGGFYVNGKVHIDGDKYQVGANITKVGSKSA